MIQTGSAISQVLVSTKLVSREPVILYPSRTYVAPGCPGGPCTSHSNTSWIRIRIVSSPREDPLDLKALEGESDIISVGGSHGHWMISL